jgi:hypothetical protein
MLIETLSQALVPARSVDQTSSTAVSRLPQATEPYGDAGTATGPSVIEAGNKGVVAQNNLLVVPYGTGSGSFSINVYGWRQILLDGNTLWVPVLLCQLAATLNTSIPGVAGSPVDNNHFFCDTLSVVLGNADVSVEAVAGSGYIAHAIVDLKGSQKVELSFFTGGSATAANALVAML